MTESNEQCAGADHDQHLCWIAAQIVKPQEAQYRWSPEEYQTLTRNPQFVCEHCGRVAAKSRNLCKPTRLLDNENCESHGHEQHLCYLVAQAVLHQEPLACCGGWPIPEGREDLVRDPHYRCAECGRVARRAENLCEPVEP